MTCFINGSLFDGSLLAGARRSFDGVGIIGVCGGIGANDELLTWKCVVFGWVNEWMSYGAGLVGLCNTHFTIFEPFMKMMFLNLRRWKIS